MSGIEWTHAVREIPGSGLAVNRQATVDEAAALATALEVTGIDTLNVSYKVAAATGGCFSLAGRLTCRITQACVVSLEPVSSNLSLPFEALFCQPGSEPNADEGEAGDDLDGPEREPITNGMIDVGRIVFEEMASGIDPYPRTAGANFDWTDEAASNAETHPFAALKRLQTPKDPS